MHPLSTDSVSPPRPTRTSRSGKRDRLLATLRIASGYDLPPETEAVSKSRIPKQDVVGKTGAPRLAATLVGLAACAPSAPHLASDDGERIVAEARALRLETSDCASAPWPEFIATLEPTSVCRNSKGITIEVWSRYTESRGYLVPHVGVVLTSGSSEDPSYTPLAPDLYWYVLKG